MRILAEIVQVGALDPEITYDLAVADHQDPNPSTEIVGVAVSEPDGIQGSGNTALLSLSSDEYQKWTFPLQERGLDPCELEWSDNNELKSALSNPRYAYEVTSRILDWLPPEMARDIETDWNAADSVT